MIDVFLEVILDQPGSEEMNELFEGDISCSFGI
jgi:hypothetical protein